jgi:hypothetical protein
MSKHRRKTEQKNAYNGTQNNHPPQWNTFSSKGKKRATKSLPSNSDPSY